MLFYLLQNQSILNQKGNLQLIGMWRISKVLIINKNVERNCLGYFDQVYVPY